eukprot:gene2185-33800_t
MANAEPAQARYTSTALSVQHTRSGGVYTGTFKKCTLKIGADAGGAEVLFSVPFNDEHVGASICASGNWEGGLVDALTKKITPGSNVVDAGANLGTYTVQLSHKAGPTGRVFAFEPQPMIYQLMVANSINCGVGNIEAHHAALGFKNGKVSMGSALPDGKSVGVEYAQAVRQGVSVNYGGRSLGVGGEVVAMHTLDSFNITNLSLIKIDVQGAENLLIWGAKETILREKPAINIEDNIEFNARMTSPENIHLFQMPPEVVSFNAITWLKSIGYEVEFRHIEDVIMVYKGPP